MSNEQSYILRIPEGDRAKQLELKRNEYLQRLAREMTSAHYMAPEIRKPISTDWIACTILSELINHGTVNSFEFSLFLASQHESEFDSRRFDTAFEKIRQYVETGKAGNKLLPPLPRES